MRKIIKALANIFGLFWMIIPLSLSNFLIKFILVVSTRWVLPKTALVALLRTRDAVDLLINERAMVYGNGEHPKHRLTQYHEFFVQNIENGQKVLDIGCGYGAVARSIAAAHPNSKVLGLDYCEDSIRQADSTKNPKNLSFILSDVHDGLPTGDWDVVVLSNVLEHIVDRIALLNSLTRSLPNCKFLIRVPLFERDWQMALRKELNVDFRSDPDHKIEHSLSEFENEINCSGLSVCEFKTLWGEIWSVCHEQRVR